MLILVTQLIGRPVVTFDEAEPLGALREPIIDPQNGKVAGYFFGHSFFFFKPSVIAAEDIVGYDEARVLVQKADVVHKAADEPKIKTILDQKIPILRGKVITESGKFLGRANDLLLDTELNMIVRYYVHGLIHDRIIPAEHVIRIEKRGIIVDDATPSAAGVAAEAEPT